jgi:large repetitive protein
VFLMRLAAVADDSAPYQPLQITTASLPEGRVGHEYAATVQANRSAAWRVTSGSLPPGLLLSHGGELTGAPTVTGEWTFEVTAMEPTSFVPRTLTISVR